MAGLNENTFDYVAQEQLEGLMLPPETPPINTTLWLGLLLISSLLVLGFWRWNKQRNSALFLAQKKLSALEAQCKDNTQDTSQLALQLNSLLCQGLGIKRLDQYQATDVQAWTSFHTKINSLCYSNSPINQKGQKGGVCALTLLPNLIKEAKHWLAVQGASQTHG